MNACVASHSMFCFDVVHIWSQLQSTIYGSHIEENKLVKFLTTNAAKDLRSYTVKFRKDYASLVHADTKIPFHFAKRINILLKSKALKQDQHSIQNCRYVATNPLQFH